MAYDPRKIQTEYGILQLLAFGTPSKCALGAEDTCALTILNMCPHAALCVSACAPPHPR